MADSHTPGFRRQETWRLKRVRTAWRRPRGVTSRMRKEKKGWPARVKNGYGTSRSLRGRHPSGFVEKLVETETDLGRLNSKEHIVRLAAGLGQKKRRVLLESARELNLRVVNPGKEQAAPVGEPATPESSTAAEKVEKLHEAKHVPKIEETEQVEEENK